MGGLAEKECVPCKGGVPPLKGEEIERLHDELGDSWEVVEEHHLRRSFDFPNFRSALDWVNAVGEIAEEAGHHPDVHLSWGKVVIEIWTHKIDGLTESDFVLAARIDALEKRQKTGEE